MIWKMLLLFILSLWVKRVQQSTETLPENFTSLTNDQKITHHLVHFGVFFQNQVHT